MLILVNIMLMIVEGKVKQYEIKKAALVFIYPVLLQVNLRLSLKSF